MDADEKVGTKLVGKIGAERQVDGGAVGETNVLVPGHEHAIARALEDFFHPEGHIKGEGLFIHAEFFVFRARVGAAMAGIEHDELRRRVRQKGHVVGRPEQRRDNLDDVELADPEAVLVDEHRFAQENPEAVEMEIPLAVLEREADTARLVEGHRLIGFRPGRLQAKMLGQITHRDIVCVMQPGEGPELNGARGRGANRCRLRLGRGWWSNRGGRWLRGRGAPCQGGAGEQQAACGEPRHGIGAFSPRRAAGPGRARGRGTWACAC